jgi:hypothetical protein
MRAATAAELAVLASKDRADHTRVKIENADGVMVEVTNLAGHDWVDDVTIDVRVEPLISTATITLFRTIGLLSLAPLIESSGLNVDSTGSYAPLVYPNRMATVETASMLQGEVPASGDWVLVWEGLGKVVEWGGSDNKVTFQALDPMTRLARTFIRTPADYGSDALDEFMEDVIQELLDDVFGASEIELAFTATSFAMLERPIGNVTVLEALQAITDLNAWNLHWRWNESAGAFRLTLWEPDRSNTTAVHTLGPDDYYEIPRISLDDEGVRNDGEVVYTDTSGDVQTETDTRAASIALYETRFIRVDARDSSVSTDTKAAALLEAILDDTESPLLPQEIDAAYFWPIELGDLLALSPGEHYDTEQKFGVFGYRHVLRADDCRTYIIGSGKPSGGFERWHQQEADAPDRVPEILSAYLDTVRYPDEADTGGGWTFALEGVYVELNYVLSESVQEIVVVFERDQGAGLVTDTYTHAVSGSGRIRLTPIARDTYTDVSFTITPRTQVGGGTKGKPVTFEFGGIKDRSTGLILKQGANEFGGSHLKVGSGITLTLDADGFPQISAAGGEGVVALEDVGDVGPYASLAAGDGLVWSGSDWVNSARRIFDVTMPPFNADNSGATDPLAAIHDAIAAATVGSTVRLPAGTYATSDVIVIDKAIRFEGGGTSTDSVSGTAIVPSVSVSPVIKVVQDDAQIRGVYVRGFQAADVAIHLSDEVEGISHIIVEDVVTTVCTTALLIDVVILSEIRNSSFVSGNVDIQGLATSLTFTSCFVKGYQGTAKGAYHVDGTSGYINFIGCGADENEGYGYWVGDGSNAVSIKGCGAEANALGFARILGDNVGIYNCHGFSNGADLNGSTHFASGVTAVGAKWLSVVGFQDFTPSGGANRLANHHLNASTSDSYVRGGLADLGVRDQGTRNTVFGLPLEGSEARGNAFNYAGNMFAANVITTDVATLADDATPSVLNGTKFVTGGTTGITDFDDGVVGQTIEVLSAHAVTVTHGASAIVLKGGADFGMAVGDALTLTMFVTGVWQEVARKVAAPKEANGTATLINGTTTVVVTHGLGAAPDIKDINVTPSEAWGAFTQFWKHSPTATEFVIEVDQDPGQDVDFSWSASVQVETPQPLNLWISKAEIDTRPMSGADWTDMLATADATWPAAEMDDQDATANLYVMAGALVYLRTGTVSYRTKVESYIEDLIAEGYPKVNGQALGYARNLGSFVLAADMCNIRLNNPTLHADFSAFAEGALTESYVGGGMTSVRDGAYARPNNIGNYCRWTCLITYAYIGDQTELDGIVEEVAFWLGDRTRGGASALWGPTASPDLSWHEDPTDSGTLRGIVSQGVTRFGHDFSGIQPEEMRRDDSFWSGTFPSGATVSGANLGATAPTTSIVGEKLFFTDDGNVSRVVDTHNVGTGDVTWSPDLSSAPAEDDQWSVYPGETGLRYVEEAAGIALGTVEIIRRLGYGDAHTWSDSALLRACTRLKYFADNHSDNNWVYFETSHEGARPLVNYLYGVGYPETRVRTQINGGIKGFSFTYYTHLGRSVP